MKKVLLFSSLFILFFGVMAQGDGKLIVGVTPFTASSNPTAEKYASNVTERVLDILNNSNRFTVIDLTSEAARKAVIEKSQENYKADNWIDANKAMNAEYTLAADIGTLKFIHLTSSQPNGYKVSIGFTMKIIQTESGKIIATHTFQSAESKISITPEGALLEAMTTIQDELKSYFEDNFPFKTLLAKAQEEKKDETKSVLILAGTPLRLKKGAEFSVYIIDKSLAKPLSVEIGRIKFDSDIDENYSLCKVTNGGDKIHASIAKSDKIYCKLLK